MLWRVGQEVGGNAVWLVGAKREYALNGMVAGGEEGRTGGCCGVVFFFNQKTAYEV